MLVLIILVAFAAGGLAGYLVRTQIGDASVVLSAKEVVTEEYLTPPDTFSKVRNTRNALDGLSARVEIGIREALAAYDRLPQTNAKEKSAAEQVLGRAIQAGEDAMEEFEGTEQQITIVQPLLHALRKGGRFDRWIELYTRALYTHPTHRAVCDLAVEAVKIGQASGQQQRVIEALRYADNSRTTFAGRAEIEAAVNSALALAKLHNPLQSSQAACSFSRLQL